MKLLIIIILGFKQPHVFNNLNEEIPNEPVPSDPNLATNGDVLSEPVPSHLMKPTVRMHKQK